MPKMGSLFVRRIPLPLIMDPFDILLHSYTPSLVLLMHQTIHSGVSEVSMCDTVQKFAFYRFAAHPYQDFICIR